MSKAASGASGMQPIALRGYVPSAIIVPDDPAIERLTEFEPAINDDTAKKHAKYDSFYSDSE